MAVGCSVSILSKGLTKGRTLNAKGRTQGRTREPGSREGRMISIENVSRRGFLKGVVGTGAFVLGVRLMPMDLLASGDVGAIDPSAPMNKAPLHPSVYVAIDTDGTAYIVAHRSEMGNGVRTALPRIVADELDADWARVKVVQATGDEKYGEQGKAGVGRWGSHF